MFAMDMAELRKDNDYNKVAAVPGSCQICSGDASLRSSFLKLQYVFVSVIRNMRVRNIRKLVGNCAHKNFSWCDKYSIALQHGVENGSAKGMQKERIYHGKKNFVWSGTGT